MRVELPIFGIGGFDLLGAGFRAGVKSGVLVASRTRILVVFLS